MKKNLTKLNQKGMSILPIAIAVATAVPIVLLSFSSEIAGLFRSNHAQRVYNMMTVVESKIRALAAEPIAYTGCGAPDTSSCVTNDALVWNVFFPPIGGGVGIMTVAGTKCAAPPCGITMTKAFHWATTSMDVTIKYNGTELGTQITPTRTFTVQIPTEVLQPDKVDNCPLGSPFFEGFNAAGNPICRTWSTANCPTGSFITSINSDTMDFTCSPLPAGPLPGGFVGCPATQFMNQATWTGSTLSPTVTCLARKDPFLLGWPLQ